MGIVKSLFMIFSVVPHTAAASRRRQTPTSIAGDLANLFPNIQPDDAPQVSPLVPSSSSSSSFPLLFLHWVLHLVGQRSRQTHQRRPKSSLSSSSSSAIPCSNRGLAAATEPSQSKRRPAPLAARDLFLHLSPTLAMAGQPNRCLAAIAAPSQSKWQPTTTAATHPLLLLHHFLLPSPPLLCLHSSDSLSLSLSRQLQRLARIAAATTIHSHATNSYSIGRCHYLPFSLRLTISTSPSLLPIASG